jgi:hypothetical protein
MALKLIPKLLSTLPEHFLFKEGKQINKKCNNLLP